MDKCETCRYDTGDYVCHPHCGGCDGKSKYVPKAPKYIDAVKLKEDVIKKSNAPSDKWDTQGILNVINEQESADVAPVRHGEWLVSGECYECSECGGGSNVNTNPYCWKCGAKMDGMEIAKK